MGTVWLCQDQVLHRPVAVKQIHTLPGESADDTRRAMREARSAAAVNHRNAVSIYDVVEHDGAPWLVMEYVPSHTLAELLEAGPLPPERVAAIGAQVAAALASAHALGIIHRDVKPGNILVGEEDLAKISDFGIARIDHDDQLTQTGLMSGTPAYFSPELARGGDPGRQSDVWALGATLYAAVEGRPPFRKQANAMAMLHAIASETVARPTRAGFLLGPIGHLMDPDPSSRWTMAEAESALRRLAGTPAAGDPDEAAATAAFAAPAPVPAPMPAPAPASEPETYSALPPVRERPHPGPSSEPEQRRSRFFPVALALAALLLLGIAAVVWVDTLGSEDPSTTTTTTPQDETSTSQSPFPPQSSDQESSDQESPTAEGSPTAGESPTGEESPTTEESPTAGETPTEEESATEDPEDPEDPEETETQQPPPTGATAAKVEAVQTYFATLPGDVDTGFALLSPSFQQRVGSSSYNGFWATISAVDVTDIEVRGNTVSALVTYTGTDGSASVESQTLTLVPGGAGGYLIDSDR